ncbi:MAG: Wzz/FepE/Etk N-terminal domain-containing protein, partial [Wenzhouxiangella sp.]
MDDGKDKKPGQHLQAVQQGNHQMAVYDPLMQQRTGAEDDDTIDLQEYWRVLVKRRWTVLGVVGIVTVAAFLVTLLMIPEYRATAQVQVNPPGSRILSYDDFSADQGGARAYQDYLGTQVQILGGRALAELQRPEALLAFASLAVESNYYGFLAASRL